MFKKMIISLLIFGLIFCLYILFAFSNIGVFKSARTLWIETAMSTASHHWLATKFIPSDKIQEVLDNRVTFTEVVVKAEELKPVVKDETFFEKEMRCVEGTLDLGGNEVLVVNKTEDIVIVKVKGNTYEGKMAIIGDPSRVKVSNVKKGSARGWSILEHINNSNAILAINASGFPDVNGVGSGSNIMGLSKSKDYKWGTYLSDYNTIGFNTEDKLVVGVQTDWSNIRDGVQFNPALIINGEQNVKGTAGWGLQPRTAIGQREDGTVFLLIIDGRQPRHSIGATMEDLVKEFKKYNVLNAAACDGGSSSIMGYKDKIITECSSPQKGGRYLPNAFIVEKKKQKIGVDISGLCDFDNITVA